MKKSIAIFGCGAAGKGAWTQLKTKYQIAAFLDNDAAKQGSRLFGVRIANPETYDYRAVDHVFIASMYVDEILVQLLGIGVPAAKIEYVKTENLSSTFVPPASFALLRSVCYMPFRLLR